MSIAFFGIPLSLIFQCCKEVINGTIKAKNLVDTLPVKSPILVLDTLDYKIRLNFLANGDAAGKWPPKGPYPLPGAILPFYRIVAFYGNLYSKRMGILGEYPAAEMLEKLKKECLNWEKADSTFPVKPALHYIAVTAQTEGQNKNLRMPFHQIEKILSLAKKIDALVFLDIQVGWSSLEVEIPKLEKFLKLPNVHLGIDPEFSMKSEILPGKQIGTFDAKDINYASKYLSKLVKKYQLSPKILVVHRFTKNMVTNVRSIKIFPEVQFVMDMDGFGTKELKKSTYQRHIYTEPVQFTGFKIFYKNDTKTSSKELYTPDELLKFIPRPIYIQYH
jgi:hypothetical protein